MPEHRESEEHVLLVVELGDDSRIRSLQGHPALDVHQCSVADARSKTEQLAPDAILLNPHCLPGVDFAQSHDAAILVLAEESQRDQLTLAEGWAVLGNHGEEMGGRILGAVAAQRARRRALRRERRRSNLHRQGGIGTWFSEDDVIEYDSGAAAALGLDPSQASTAWDQFAHSMPTAERNRFLSWLQSRRDNEEPDHLLTRVQFPDRGTRWLMHTARPPARHGADDDRLEGMVFDVTGLREALAHELLQVHHDQLTGLASRDEFEVKIVQSIEKARDSHCFVAVLFIDLDRFKKINDSLGHGAGDRLLRSIAQRLVQGVNEWAGAHGKKEAPCLARIGSDQFALLLDELESCELAVEAGRTVLQLMHTPLEVDGQELFATVSVGISLFPVDHLDPELLLKSAETAMHHAKDLGRNNLQLYSSSMNSMALERLTLETNLRKALDQDELRVYYQTRHDIHSCRVVGMEALIRWHHPEFGLISPAQFIPIAEETSLILQIGDWVFDSACRQLREWLDEGLPPVRMSVNLSAHQFGQPDLAEKILRSVEGAKLDPSLLELELTESTLMRNVEVAIRVLRELKSAGLRIAIDDFGTGYSSLAYLKQFPLDVIKVDRSFVREIMTDLDHREITTAIVRMAQSLNLEVVAEGVETEDQLEFLRTLNCTEAQGYLFTPPVPALEVVEMLRDGSLAPVG